MEFSIKGTSEFIAPLLGKATIGLAIASTCGIPAATLPAVLVTAFLIDLVYKKIVNEIQARLDFEADKLADCKMRVKTGSFD